MKGVMWEGELCERGYDGKKGMKIGVKECMRGCEG